MNVKKSVVHAILTALVLCLPSLSPAQQEQADSTEGMKLFLMIGKPTPEYWERIIRNEVDLSVKGIPALESMGGKLLGYYIGVSSSHMYGIIAFPDSSYVSKIVFDRAMKGIVLEQEFIEIMSTAEAAKIFSAINKSGVGGNI